jgi:ABC-type lipoprotein release transport system permease subunit
MMKTKKNHNSGFTLVLSIFLSAIVLTITLAMMNILYKQLTLSTADRESQIAFFAADTGMECAYYWDFRADLNGSTTQSIFGDINTLSTPIATIAPTCAGQNIYTQTGPGGETAFDPVGTNAFEYVRTFYINNLNGTQACAFVTVKKNISSATTSIEAHGQNRCVAGDLRRVERAIQFRY